MTQLIECVPNVSEGRDRRVIDAIADAVAGVPDVKLLDVDPGADTNRTVFTFVGPPSAVVEAAFRVAARTIDLIDMSQHHGAHPRLGALDVCPLVPVAGVTMADCVQWARQLGQRIADTFEVPVFFYEHAATTVERRSLATIRAGEYEGLAARLLDPQWRPDAGPARFNRRTGAFVVGAREFLLAYNVNLNTTDRRLAQEIALTIREMGRLKRDGSGAVEVDGAGHQLRTPGRLKAVRAIGWYIDQYRQAQVSINLLDYHVTPLHLVFETVREEADKLGLLVTGSELVGLTPLEPLVQAGRYYLSRQGKSPGLPERTLVDLAVQSLGLSQLSPFQPAKKIIEYHFRDDSALTLSPVSHFTDRVSADTPTPGGGSVAALAGSLAAALTAMVANLTVGRSGYEQVSPAAADLALRAQSIKDRLLGLVDRDAAAFDAVMVATRMPKTTDDQQRARAEAIERATENAARVPLETAQLCAQAAALSAEVAAIGLRASASDAGVAAGLARAASEGAALNVLINLGSIEAPAFRSVAERDATVAVEQARAATARALAAVNATLTVPARWLS